MENDFEVLKNSRYAAAIASPMPLIGVNADEDGIEISVADMAAEEAFS